MEVLQGRVSVVVDYSGVGEKLQSFAYATPVLADLQGIAKTEAARLNDHVGYDKAIAPGLLLDITPVVEAPPVVDVGMGTFLTAQAAHLVFQRAVLAGFRKADDPDVLAAATAYAAAFKPGYEPYVVLP